MLPVAVTVLMAPATVLALETGAVRLICSAPTMSKVSVPVSGVTAVESVARTVPW